MDLNDFWQENKRFLMTVAGGFLVLLIGLAVIDRVYGRDLKRANNSIRGSNTALKQPRYQARDLAKAESTNRALKETVATLSEAVAFEAREEFRVVDGAGPASSQFFAVTQRVREDLMRQAGRQGMRIPEDLGLPGLSPTSEDAIARTLEGLDAVDRIVRLALDAGVERIDELKISLDPALESRKGVGALERTRVAVSMSGASAPIVRFIQSSQGPTFGAPLLIDEFEVVPARRKTTEARLEATFLVCRLHETVTEPDA